MSSTNCFDECADNISVLREGGMNLKREIANLINLLAAPAEVYNDINASPRWRMPAALLIIISPMIGFFIIPAAIEPLRRIYEESFGGRAAEIALQTSIHYFTIINVVIEPFSKIIRWVILSAAIYFVVALFNRNASLTFSKVFAIVAYSEIIFHLMDILTLLIIHARGIEQIITQTDLVIFKGVNCFFDQNAIPSSLYNALNYLNPFAVWYIAVVSRGIQISAGTDYTASLIYVAISWCIWLALKANESYVLENALKLYFH